MREKVKNIIATIVLVVMAIAIVIGIGKPIVSYIYNNRHIKFEDETMGQVLCNAVRGSEVTLENVKYKDLKKIKRLRIGYTGYYSSLQDMGYCTELENLCISNGTGREASFIDEGQVAGELSEEEVNKSQNDLAKVLPKLSNLRELWLGGDTTWTSVEFMRGCTQVEEVSLYNCQATDYSAFKECSSLKSLVITYSQLTNAEDLIGLESLEYLCIMDTPLAENEEEINKLKEAYPNAYINY